MSGVESAGVPLSSVEGQGQVEPLGHASVMLSWTKNGWEDYLYWQKTDKAILKRINALLKEAMRTPFEGLGKPEPLKFDLAGCWSRRINHEHRLVYSFHGETRTLVVLQCRYHY